MIRINEKYLEISADELCGIKYREKQDHMQSLDYHILSLISNKTGFNANKIKILSADKTKMKSFNEFNRFEFIYEDKHYILEDNKLKEPSN